MATRKKDQQIENLEQLIVEMALVIRDLDVEKSYSRFWKFADETGVSPRVVEINKIKEQSSIGQENKASEPPVERIKVIIWLEDGNIQNLHATTDLDFVVINVDDIGDEPIILGNIEKPNTVKPDLSLQDIDIELDGVAGYEAHPWKGN